MIHKKAFYLFLFCLVIPFITIADDYSYTLPKRTIGVKKNVISLNGTWKFKYDTNSDWDDITVPSEAVMQGYGITHDKSFFYKKTFLLPKDFQGKKVILRFDGVYSEATLFINGKRIRMHKGGFTRWETDITAALKKGEANELELEVVDRLNDISYASGYAHHPIGGILRDVTVFAIGDDPLFDFGLETVLDKNYRNALLKLNFKADDAKGGKVKYRLIDSKGRLVPGTAKEFDVKSGDNTHGIEVSNPLKWDAEHPNLYNLEVRVLKNGKESYSFQKQVGFRKIEIIADQMFVNGKPIKLRGANRHDVHPTLGRVSTAYYDSLDVQLFKQAHINFVRTSHYPPSERFVEFCNQYGIYVEVETAVCFVDTYRQKNYAPGATQNDPAHTDQYLSQCREMVGTFRTHPAVIIWSIGNESIYGMNFRKSWDYVKSVDTSRPVIWSYPGAQKEDPKIYEILSMHYQDVNGNLTQFGKTTRGYEGHGIPALFDEWAHPACYTYQTLRDDPNIREFWGISMDMMWGRLFPTKGGLGGAIWGYVDDVFAVPQKLKKGNNFWKEFAKSAKPEGFQGEMVGYGEWGIVDVWRRPKPEFWSTKKAQSPIRLLQEGKVIASFAPKKELNFNVYNRYDHTVLDEITLEYTFDGKKKSIVLPAIQPHEKGSFVIPAENWKDGESILLNFIDHTGLVVDTYEYFFGKRPIEMPKAIHKGAIQLSETDKYLVFHNENFEIPVNKVTGLIENATKQGQIFIEKGPFLNMDINLNHLTGAEVRKSADKYLVKDSDWKNESVQVQLKDGEGLITLVGHYNGLKVHFDITISPDGDMVTHYHTVGEPNGYLREIGVKYYLHDAVDRLQWEREGYWNYYPEGDFAGNKGKIKLFESKQVAYGQKPEQGWAQDTHNYYYWADKGARSEKPLTQEGKGMKENIYYYSLGTRALTLMSVISEKAELACRMDRLENEQLVLYVNNKWDYPEIAWGNYCKTLEASPCKGAFTIRF